VNLPLLYHPAVKTEDLPAIPSNIKKRIKRAIEERLMTEPLKFGEPLRRSLKGYRKLRVGNYRIIYKITRDSIIVLKIGHRKEVYSQVDTRL